MSGLPITFVCIAALIAAAAASAGCTVRARATPVGHAELHYATTYRSYPHTYYDGRDVYYVSGRWMYLDGDVWTSYPSEPAPLYRYRTAIEEAPPAPRYYPGSSGYVQPPAPRYYPDSSGYVQPPAPAPVPAPYTAPAPERVR